MYWYGVMGIAGERWISRGILPTRPCAARTRGRVAVRGVKGLTGEEGFSMTEPRLSGEMGEGKAGEAGEVFWGERESEERVS